MRDDKFLKFLDDSIDTLKSIDRTPSQDELLGQLCIAKSNLILAKSIPNSLDITIKGSDYNEHYPILLRLETGNKNPIDINIES